MLPFTFVCCALGTSLAIVLAFFMPARRTQDVLVVLAVLASYKPYVSADALLEHLTKLYTYLTLEVERLQLRPCAIDAPPEVGPQPRPWSVPEPEETAQVQRVEREDELSL